MCVCVCTDGGRGEGVVEEGKGTGGDENMARGKEGGVYGKGNLVVDVAKRGSRCSDHHHHHLVGYHVIQHFFFLLVDFLLFIFSFSWSFNGF